MEIVYCMLFFFLAYPINTIALEKGKLNFINNMKEPYSLIFFLLFAHFIAYIYLPISLMVRKT